MLYEKPHLVLCAALVVMAGVTLWIARYVGFNSSPSAAPVGFYWRTAEAPKRGDLVEVCLPEAVAEFGLARGYIGYGSCPGHAESVGKILLAMPGDTVTVSPAMVLKTDSLGRPIEHFPFGKYRLKPGEIWLYGAAHNSWGSQYYGPVPMSGIRATLTPLFTW